MPLPPPALYQGYVGKDWEELLFVVITLGLSFALMIAFGLWWQR